jgi:hypothetical protein
MQVSINAYGQTLNLTFSTTRGFPYQLSGRQTFCFGWLVVFFITAAFSSGV